MSNPLAGWCIISRQDLHEMARPVPYSQSTEKRVKLAKEMAWLYKHPNPPYGYKKRIENFYRNM